MRVRLAIVPVVLAATSLVACSSSSKSGNGTTANTGAASTSSSMTTSTPASTGASSSTSGGGGSTAAFCADLQSLGSKVSDLSSKLSDPSSLKAALSQYTSYLDKLKNDAPSDMASTIGELETLFQEAQSALSGSTPDMSKLQGLATKLPDDVTKLEQYATANCK